MTRSLYQRLSDLDGAAVNATLEAMRREARAVVEPGAGGRALVETRTAYMRYVGQGHEVGVEIPVRVHEAALGEDAGARLLAAFETAYHRLYERTIPNLDVEVLSWVLLLSTREEHEAEPQGAVSESAAESVAERAVVDTASGEAVTAKVYDRARLAPGTTVTGPAVLVEKDTTTVVSPAFDATVHSLGHVVMTARGPDDRSPGSRP